MHKILLTAATLAIAVSALAVGGTGSSQAATSYPWCAATSGERQATDCSFTSFAQCEATVSGGSGTCEQNPAFFNSQARYQRQNRPLLDSQARYDRLPRVNPPVYGVAPTPRAQYPDMDPSVNLTH